MSVRDAGAGWVVAVVSCAVLIPGVGVAQESAQRAQRVLVEGRAGHVSTSRDVARTGLQEARGFAELEEPGGATSLGVGVSVAWSPRVLTRVTVDHDRDSRVTGQWKCAPFEACPSVLLLVDGSVRRWSVGADLVVRPWVVAERLPVTAFVGTGLVRSRISWPSPNPQVPIPTSYHETNPFLRGGVGVSHPVGRLEPFVEVQGTVARFGGGEEELPGGVVPSGRRGVFEGAFRGGIRLAIR